MLEYDRVDVSEGVDVNKTNGLRDSITRTFLRYILDFSQTYVMIVMI